MPDGNTDITRMYQMMAAATALGHPAAETAALKGTRRQVVATAKVLSATRDLSDCLSSDSPTLRQVMSRVDRKNEAAASFLRHVGVPWPL